jgi:hypothetical protein
MLGREFAGRDAITQVASFRALGNEFSDEGVQLLMGLVTCSPWCRSAAVGGSLADMGLRAALGGVTIGVVARVTWLLRANSETDQPACVILAGAGWERLGEGSGDGVIGCRCWQCGAVPGAGTVGVSGAGPARPCGWLGGDEVIWCRGG